MAAGDLSATAQERKSKLCPDGALAGLVGGGGCAATHWLGHLKFKSFLAGKSRRPTLVGAES